MSDECLSITVPAPRQGAQLNSSAIKSRVAALYEEHRDEIYRFLVGQGLEPAKAQDLAQDVFVDLFVSLMKGSRITSERAWLFTVAARVAVDHWRREGRCIWIELDSSPAIADNLRSPEMNPEATLVRRQRLRRVALTLASLPRNQRMAIHLRLQGLRYRAIAAVLGVSVSTTSEMLSTAVERLRSTAHE